ncbi:alpha/beta hydrolase [Undibacterium danionis]|uniref:Alpha/beta hydrolase n=1 Tax=Undibacterium danionis TaxID=1812100 RepID=A0ABV6IIW3_9BURK
MRFLFALISIFSLSACQTYVVRDLDLIRPDYLTGYKTKEVFDAEKLNKTLPEARLKEEVISANQMNSEIVQIKGLSVVLPEAKTTVLYFGGNLTHVDENAPHLSKIAASCPVNFATFDYRGYGRSNGQPDALVLKDDSLRIYDHVRAKISGKLVVHGFSLGSFMAAYIAANRSVDGLVLEGSSTYPDELVNAQIPWYFKPFVTVTVSDNLKTISNTQAVSNFVGKVLVITGEKDTSTPAYLGRALFESIPSQEKEYIMVPNGTHNNLMSNPQVQVSYCKLVQ